MSLGLDMEEVRRRIRRSGGGSAGSTQSSNSGRTSRGGTFGTSQSSNSSLLDYINRQTGRGSGVMLPEGGRGWGDVFGDGLRNIFGNSTPVMDQGGRDALMERLQGFAGSNAAGGIGNLMNRLRDMFKPAGPHHTGIPRPESDPNYRNRQDDSMDSIMQMIQAAMSGANSMGQYTPSGNFSTGLDAAEMAAKQFDPQYQLLDQLRDQATERYTDAGNETQQMYNALADSIRSSAQEHRGTYDTTRQNLDVAFNNANESVNQSAADSQEHMAGIMRRLGLGAAAPDVLNNIEAERSRAINNLAGNNQAVTQANEQLGQNMQDYQENIASSSGIAGANRRASIMEALGGVLSGYDNRQLDLRGQQAEAENRYGMQISEMEAAAQQAEMNAFYEAQQTNATNLMDQLKMMVDQARWDKEFASSERMNEHRIYNDRAQRDLDLMREQRMSNPVMEALQGPDFSNNPLGALTNEALSLFGSPQKATAAIDVILQAVQGSPTTDIRHLMANLKVPEGENITAYQTLLHMYNRLMK